VLYCLLNIIDWRFFYIFAPPIAQKLSDSFADRQLNKKSSSEEFKLFWKALPLSMILWIYDIRDGISKSLGIYLTIQRYIQEIYTIEIISNVTFHVSGPFVVRINYISRINDLTVKSNILTCPKNYWLTVTKINLNGMYIPTAESTTDFTNDILITKPISNKQR